jgi:YVTN family beta-propeller protein
MVVTPNGRTFYVANTTSASVTPIRVSSNSPLADIPVGTVPARMVITPSGRTVYTVNATDNSVTPIRVSRPRPLSFARIRSRRVFLKMKNLPRLLRSQMKVKPRTRGEMATPQHRA